MIARSLQNRVVEALTETPAVALLGPRQVGKTTLALSLARRRPSVYLDLESETDLSKLAEPELYLDQHRDRLVILDEIQRAPDLFRSPRGLIDRGRRRGLRAGRFLLAPQCRQAAGQVAEGLRSRQRSGSRAARHRRPRDTARPSGGGRQLGGQRHRVAARLCAEGTEASFYRTSAGAEIDLVLFRPAHSFVVYAGTEAFPLGDGVEALGLLELSDRLASLW